MEVKACDTQEINQINTCYPTTSWSETPVRPIDKNGPILPIVCWSDISGGSTQYQSVNGCFSWLPHWTGRRLGGFSGTSAGSNSLSLALIHTWESDDLCLLLLATHTMTFFISLRAYSLGQCSNFGGWLVSIYLRCDFCHQYNLIPCCWSEIVSRNQSRGTPACPCPETAHFYRIPTLYHVTVS